MWKKRIFQFSSAKCIYTYSFNYKIREKERERVEILMSDEKKCITNCIFFFLLVTWSVWKNRGEGKMRKYEKYGKWSLGRNKKVTECTLWRHKWLRNLYFDLLHFMHRNGCYIFQFLHCRLVFWSYFLFFVSLQKRNLLFSCSSEQH